MWSGTDMREEHHLCCPKMKVAQPRMRKPGMIYLPIATIPQTKIYISALTSLYLLS